MKKLIAVVLTLTMFAPILEGQSRFELDELYRDANSFFFFEDYEEALALYLKLHQHFPENANLNFRIGFCYLSIHGSRARAIPYLEQAVTSITQRYNHESIVEQKAPVDAIFYLGNAYFINNQFDKAEEAYNKFNSIIRRQRGYDLAYFEHQVESLKRSRAFQRHPVNFIRFNLGEGINDRFSNFNAVISGDGSTLAFTTRRRFYQAVFVATRVGEGWSVPKNITIDLVVDGNCQTLCLSYTGEELYLFKEYDHVGNIYVSRQVNGQWTPMKPLNTNINTEFYETHASISSDGKRLYFASNRAGGYGGQDLYISERTDGGDWGPATNLGPTINTRYNEITPFITPDNQTLFFSSEGHNTMGRYDLFFSQLQNRTWSKPINLGFPLSTPDDDIFYHPIGDGSTGLMALFDPEGFGEMDIYQIEIFLPKYQRSIITSNDLYSRTTELPPKTLIVDTLNYPGIALLDPLKPLHQKYLNPQRAYKLFFDGKVYSMRDQHQLVSPRDFAVAVDKKPDALAGLPQRQITPLAPGRIDSLSSEAHAPTEQLRKEEGIAFDTAPYKPVSLGQLAMHDTASQHSLITSDALTSILLNLADTDTKPYLEEMFLRDWEVPQSMLMLQASRLVRQADSLGISPQMAHLFAQFLDILSNLPHDAMQQRPRRISQVKTSEEFFFWHQRLKREASPELAELLDYCIINDPNINSFELLWLHLNSHHATEAEQYFPELLNLMAQHAFRGFFNLPNESQLLVSRVVDSRAKGLPYIWPLVVGLLLLAGIVFVIICNHRKSLCRNIKLLCTRRKS